MEEALSKKRFLLGTLLAWAPWIPTVIGFGYVFVSSKATGLAAVAGGMGEFLIWWGIATMMICQVVAIVWLFRSFSGTHIMRSLIAAVSVFASGLMLVLVCAFLIWWRHFLGPGPSR